MGNGSHDPLPRSAGSTALVRSAVRHLRIQHRHPVTLNLTIVLRAAYTSSFKTGSLRTCLRRGKRPPRHAFQGPPLPPRSKSVRRLGELCIATSGTPDFVGELSAVWRTLRHGP